MTRSAANIMRTWLKNALTLTSALLALLAPLLYGSTWLTAGIIAAALALVAWLHVRESRSSFLGPHFYFDLVRLARQGKTLWVRLIYLLCLLGVLIWVRWDFSLRFDFFRFEGVPAPWHASLNDQAMMAERFIYAVLLVQNLGILILCPVYFAGAIAEEKEQQTLGLLFTTDLNSREIYAGKLFGRLVQVGVIVLASLPILSILIVFGAVDMRVLLFNFLYSALLLVTVGSCCLAVSAMSFSVFAAVIASYTLIFVLGGSCAFWFGGVGKFVVLPPEVSESSFDSVFLIALPYMLVTLCCWVIGVVALEESRVSIQAYDVSIEERPATVSQSTETSGLPSGEVDALLWKETHVGTLNSTILLMLVPVLLPVLVMARMGSVAEFRHWLDNVKPFLVALIDLGLAFVCLAVALRSSACVVRERQRHTMDGLLVLPLERNELLTAKWLGTLYRNGGVLAFLFFLVLAAMLTGAFNPCWGIHFIGSPLIFLLFLNGLGLFFSVTSNTVMAARLKMMGVLLFLTGGSFALDMLLPFSRESMLVLLLHYGLNPLVIWNQGAYEQKLPPGPNPIIYAVYGHMLLLALAKLFWDLAVWRFNRTTR